MINKQIGGGLTASKFDPRDFSFGSVYGLPELTELPDEYKVSDPIKIKDQGDSDLCTAFAVTEVSEDQELQELSPEFQFAMTKKLKGEWESWGADLRTACKSAVKIGSILQVNVPEHLKLMATNRNTIAQWDNWPNVFSTLDAPQFKKKSYFKVDGRYSIFDNFRATLWQNRKEERSIMTGVTWQNHWTYSDGSIDTANGTRMFGHAFKVFGWRHDYLIAQLSNGDVGDKGLFYFHRSVVNEEFKYGGYTFQDMPTDEAKYYIQRGIPKSNSWLKRILIRLWA